MKLLIIALLIPFFGQSQKYLNDQKKIQFSLDSAGYKLNSPKVPRDFKLFYNCDSVAFMKRTNGDTIEVYSKGGYAPLRYSSEHNRSSFIYNLYHPEEMGISYFSKFYEDGRIIKQNLSNQIYIFRNDSLYEYWIDDREYDEFVMKLMFSQSFGDTNTISMKKEIEEARKKILPIERIDFIFHKDMFTQSDSVIIDSKFNSNNNLIILERKWIQDDKTCYRLKLSQPGQPENYGFYISINDDMEFVEFEGCEN